MAERDPGGLLPGPSSADDVESGDRTEVPRAERLDARRRSARAVDGCRAAGAQLCQGAACAIFILFLMAPNAARGRRSPQGRTKLQYHFPGIQQRGVSLRVLDTFWCRTARHANKLNPSVPFTHTRAQSTRTTGPSYMRAQPLSASSKLARTTAARHPKSLHSNLANVRRACRCARAQGACDIMRAKTRGRPVPNNTRAMRAFTGCCSW